MGYGRQYAEHTLLTVGGTILAGVLFYVLRIVLYASLPAEDYGLFYLILSVAFVLHPVLSFGFDPGVVPFVTRFREEGDVAAVKQAVVGAFVPQGVVGGALIAAAWVGAGPIAAWCFDTPAAAPLIRLVAVHAGLMLVFKAGMAVLLGLQSIAARNLADLARVAVCVGSAVVFLRLGFGVEAAALAYVAGAAAAIGTEAVAIAVLHGPVVRGRFRWRPDLVREVFRSGKYLSVAYGGVLIFSHMDTVMLGLLGRDYGAVAAYQVAVPTIMIIYGLLLAVASSFMPMVTTLSHRREIPLLADGIARIYELAAVVAVPGAVLMACFSDVLMGTLWRRDVFDAPGAFNILVVGAVFYFTCYLNLQILAGMGRARLACRAIAVALGVNLVLNAVLILLFGIRGAAAATVLSHIAATAIGVAAMRRE
ncbi:MAG: polysaccharide biosynthesis C-terminal domain-containing protein, partial [Candidatus Hydrogenedentes bacterium]|nr:polysaccharide biosynthesis C-terminal domain-containing protein [Candidatus Hydrogenedentota bacterium]